MIFPEFCRQWTQFINYALYFIINVDEMTTNLKIFLKFSDKIVGCQRSSCHSYMQTKCIENISDGFISYINPSPPTEGVTCTKNKSILTGPPERTKQINKKVSTAQT